MRDIPGAVRVVRAFIRFEAVLTGLNIRREVCGKHSLHFCDACSDAFQKVVGFVENGMKFEQGVKVEANSVVDVFAVERQHSGVSYIKPGATQHP